MRNTFSYIAVLVISVCVMASCRNLATHLGMGNSHSVLISKEAYPATDIKQVIASTFGGNIEVIGDATGQATVEVWGSYRSNDSAAIFSKVNQYTNLSITRDNATLIVKAEQKKSVNSFFPNNDNVAVHFKIHVSQQVANDLKTSGGNISLARFVGDQKLNTSGGNIQIANVQGNIDGHTSGGNIDGENISGTAITLGTSGGNIDISNSKGNITLETSGGNITAKDMEGLLTAKTSGGNIDASNINGGLIGSSSGGNIDTKFTQVNASIDLDNSGGDVHISIPKNAKVNLSIASENVKVDGLTNFAGKSDKDMVEGTLNGGGPVVKARSSGGTVHLGIE